MQRIEKIDVAVDCDGPSAAEFTRYVDTFERLVFLVELGLAIWVATWAIEMLFNCLASVGTSDRAIRARRRRAIRTAKRA